MLLRTGCLDTVSVCDFVGHNCWKSKLLSTQGDLHRRVPHHLDTSSSGGRDLSCFCGSESLGRDHIHTLPSDIRHIQSSHAFKTALNPTYTNNTTTSDLKFCLLTCPPPPPPPHTHTHTQTHTHTLPSLTPWYSPPVHPCVRTLREGRFGVRGIQLSDYLFFKGFIVHSKTQCAHPCHGSIYTGLCHGLTYTGLCHGPIYTGLCHGPIYTGLCHGPIYTGIWHWTYIYRSMPWTYIYTGLCHGLIYTGLCHGPIHTGLCHGLIYTSLCHGLIYTGLCHGLTYTGLCHGPIYTGLCHGPIHTGLCHGPIYTGLCHGPIYTGLCPCLAMELCELRWPSWVVCPNEPSGFCGRKAILNHAHLLVSACP